MGFKLVVQLPSNNAGISTKGCRQRTRNSCGSFTEGLIGNAHMVPGTVTQHNAVGRFMKPLRVAMGEPNRRRGRGRAQDHRDAVACQDTQGVIDRLQINPARLGFKRGPHELTQSGRVHSQPGHMGSIRRKNIRVPHLRVDGSPIQ